MTSALNDKLPGMVNCKLKNTHKKTLLINATINIFTSTQNLMKIYSNHANNTILIYDR